MLVELSERPVMEQAGIGPMTERRTTLLPAAGWGQPLPTLRSNHDDEDEGYPGGGIDDAFERAAELDNAPKIELRALGYFVIRWGAGEVLFVGVCGVRRSQVGGWQGKTRSACGAKRSDQLRMSTWWCCGLCGRKLVVAKSCDCWGG